jgi:hypothetical protein
MLPQDIAHVGWRPAEEGLLAHAADVSAAHVQVLEGHSLEGELTRGPLKPLGHMSLAPQSGVCGHTKTHIHETSQLKAAADSAARVFVAAREQREK